MERKNTFQLRVLAATFVTESQTVRRTLATLRRVRKSLEWPAPDMHRSNVNVAYERLPLSWE